MLCMEALTHLFCCSGSLRRRRMTLMLEVQRDLVLILQFFSGLGHGIQHSRVHYSQVVYARLGQDYATKWPEVAPYRQRMQGKESCHTFLRAELCMLCSRSAAVSKYLYGLHTAKGVTIEHCTRRKSPRFYFLLAPLPSASWSWS